MSAIMEVKGGKRIPLGKTFSETPTSHIYIRVTDMKNGTLVDWNLKYIDDDVFEAIKNYTISKDDLYLTIAGTIGSIGDVPEMFDGMNLTENAVKLTYIQINKRFLTHMVNSDCVQSQFRALTNQQAQPKLSIRSILSTLVPIPPLNEQQRIADSISRIEPLINKYGNVENELKKLNENIFALLKKSILQEAIQGKLVPQIAEEGDASKLLQQIEQEKQKLVKEGKLKKKDLVSSTIFRGDDNKYYEKVGTQTTDISEEIPFEVPSSWIWCRLGSLISTKSGLSYSKDNLDVKSDDSTIVLRGGNILEGKWILKDDDVIIASEFVKPDLQLRKGYFITPAVTSWENMGKTALIEADQVNIVVGGFVLMLCPHLYNESTSRYLYYLFQSLYFKQYCQSITNKSGQAFYNLSREKLLQMLVPMPALSEMQRISDRLNAVLSSIMRR